MVDPVVSADPCEVCRGSLGPATLPVMVADAVVVAMVWLAAVGALFGQSMVLFGTSWAGVCYQ